jgi:hypothetical protein
MSLALTTTHENTAIFRGVSRRFRWILYRALSLPVSSGVRLMSRRLQACCDPCWSGAWSRSCAGTMAVLRRRCPRCPWRTPQAW